MATGGKTALQPFAEIARLAPDRDWIGAFPDEEIRLLHTAGLLRSVLAIADGGCGLGTEAEGAVAADRALRQLGRSSVSVARLFEGHINAAKLIARFGDDRLRAEFAADVRAGHLVAIWNTEGVAGVQLVDCRSGYTLLGSKSFASGVGHVDRSVITASHAARGRVLVYLDVDPVTTPSHQHGFEVQGVRAAATGTIDLTGISVPSQRVFGTNNDYLHEPDFSAGAWRTLSVQSGALEALYEHFRNALLERNHHQSPIQRARLAEIAVNCETARLWARQCALVAETGEWRPERCITYVNLGRAAVARAALSTLELVQRGIGARAFVRSHPVERIGRDLSFYLRQPAPDQTFDEAAVDLLKINATRDFTWFDAGAADD